MSTSFEGMSPREIDEAYARAREESENAMLVSTGLQAVADKVNEARKQYDSASKRLNRASDDLTTAKETLADLKGDLEARIRSAFDAGVPKSRLIEVTGVTQVSLRKILNVDPSESADSTPVATSESDV